MWIHLVIMWILIAFMFIGIIDKIRGNRNGYGHAFYEGFLSMGPLALVMIGMITISPVLANLLSPILKPLFLILGADPAIFPGMILAIDMGGYSLAIELAESREAALFSGVILSTIIGPTFVFTVPVALGFINKTDYPVLAKGIMIGLIPVPIGALLAGLIAGFPMTFLFMQLVPVLIFVAIIIAGLVWLDRMMINVFVFIGKLVMAIATITIGIVAVHELVGVELIQGLTPFRESIEIVGLIVLALAGAFPFVLFLKTRIVPLLKPIITKTGISELTWLGFMTSMAHSIPMYKKLHVLDERGKLMNIAFSVSGAFVLGGHLGFTSALEPQMVIPMMVGKVSAGIVAVFIAFLISAKSIR